MKTLRNIIIKHSLKKKNRDIYIYTNNPENSILIYRNLIEVGFKQYGSKFSNHSIYHIFSLNDNGKIVSYNLKYKSYFKDISYLSVNYRRDKLLLVDSNQIVILNYDIILRLEKIKKLRKLCMTQFPNIDKFNKENIRSCIIPHKPTKYFYEEVYNKGVLRKENLKVGSYYYGRCRNASVAMWDGNVFIYMRNKWNYTFTEEINHLQDDNGLDLFVPIEETEPQDDEKIKK